MNRSQPTDLAERLMQAAEAADARRLVVVVPAAMPIIVTLFAVVDDAEIGSGSILRTVNAVFWVALGAAALWVIKPWRPLGERPLPARVWIYAQWGWVFGALLAVAFPVFAWTSSTSADSRELAGQFWHEVARAVPLLDLPDTLGWREPLETHSIGVGVVFVAARVASLMVVATVVRLEWRNHRARSVQQRPN